MKRILPVVVWTIAALASVPVITCAEEVAASSAGNGQQQAGKRQFFNPEERLKRMSDKLGLTAEQQAKIRAMFEKNSAAFKETMAKGWRNMSEADRAKLRESMKAQREEFMAVLTPEQKQKLREQWQNRGPGGSADFEKGSRFGGHRCHGHMWGRGGEKGKADTEKGPAEGGGAGK